MNKLQQEIHRCPYALSVRDALEMAKVSKTKGLDSRQVKDLQSKWGMNRLVETAGESLARKFLRQFKSIVIGILFLAAVGSGVIGEWIETWAILAIVLMNGILGFLQESRAEKALESLRRLSTPQARVIRNAKLQSLPAQELVPGDIIELEAGDLVPADARIIESFGLRAQESALTGESEPVDKNAAEVFPMDTPLADRKNMTYLGTTITAGKAAALVTDIGMNTALGQIAGLLEKQWPESTPLQRRLAELGHLLVILCLVVVAVVVTLHLVRGGDLREVFLFAVSLAVAVIPEGLPAVVTVALALGLTRLAKRQALIRRLPSVETLGSVTVICSDKTGTLTRNEMSVRKIVAGGATFQVSGSGYSPQGEFFLQQTGKSVQIEPKSRPDLMLALTIGARCNHASVVPTSGGTNAWSVIGDPTEGALVVAALKADVSINNYGIPTIHELPFDSERKMMSVVVNGAGSSFLMFTKGAPETVVSRCVAERRGDKIASLSDKRRKEILRMSQEMASEALRVLAVAYREFANDPKIYSEEHLIFSGLVGMIDPPRAEAKEAVVKCKLAGIKPVMITGDHPATARIIAKELGIVTGDAEIATGKDLDSWSDSDLNQKVSELAVYARVSPEHKLRVVRAWKELGAIVAMTGDGVNDAPAIKAADIGIAMGITGTDVTKEASAMILMDDNFASIVNAVEEGRGILNNIQNIIHFLLAGNLSEILLVMVAVLLGWPMPLLPIQILWINLVTDGFPALALAAERPEVGIMKQHPRPPKEPLFTLGNGFRVLRHGTLLAGVMSLGFWWVLFGDSETRGDIAQAQAAAFCICAFSQLSFVFACRSRLLTLPELGIASNLNLLFGVCISMALQVLIVVTPLLQPFFFREAPHFEFETWTFIFFLGLIPVTSVELKKIAFRWKKRRHQ